MADDIVKRLRLLWTEPFDAVALYETINATAAEIVRMQAEIVRLRAEVAVLRDELRLAGEEARRG